jgi:hypothetical protein
MRNFAMGNIFAAEICDPPRANQHPEHPPLPQHTLTSARRPFQGPSGRLLIGAPTRPHPQGRGVTCLSRGYATTFFKIGFTCDSLTFKVDATLAMV